MIIHMPNCSESMERNMLGPGYWSACGHVYHWRSLAGEQGKLLVKSVFNLISTNTSRRGKMPPKLAKD